MMNKSLVTWVSKNQSVLLPIILLSLLILVVSLLKVSSSLLNSDKVVDYLLMKELISGDYIRLWYPPDNFLHRIPIIYFFDLIFGSTVENLLIVSTLDFISMYLIFGFVYYKLLKKIGVTKFWIFFITYFSFIGFFSYSLRISNLMANPFGRSSEIALSFLLFYFLLNEERWEVRFSRINLLKFFLIFTLLVIVLTSDPFLTFSFYIPLLVFLFLRFLFEKGNAQSYLYLLIIVGSVAMSFVIRVFLKDLGIIIYSENATFSDISAIFNHMIFLINDLLFLFNANFSGLPLFSLKSVVVLSNLVVLLSSLIGLILLFVKKAKNLEPVSFFLLVLFSLNLVTFLVSNRAADNHLTVHYLVLIPFILIFGLAFFLNTIKINFKITTFLLIFITASVIASGYYHIRAVQKSSIFKSEHDILLANLDKASFKYGYGSFWDSGIITFLSSNSIKVRQIVCLEGKIYPFYWATSESWYKESSYSGQSFLIYDEDDFFTKTCTKDLLEQQFGQIVSEIDLDGKVIYVWNYNLSKKFDTTKKTDNLSPFTIH